MPKKDWKQAPAKDRARGVIDRLAEEYEPVCGLQFKTPFELLIATILSAQCTDERVNQVTPALFAAYPDSAAFAEADREAIEERIRSTGFFRNKARNIVALSQTLEEEYGGQVPDTMEALVGLPGIGRKTANVVLGTAFGYPAIPVDTHVKRVALRLEFTAHADPNKIEQDLMALIPKKEQTDFSHRVIWHGRKICRASKPKCSQCRLAPFCPSEQE